MLLSDDRWMMESDFETNLEDSPEVAADKDLGRTFHAVGLSQRAQATHHARSEFGPGDVAANREDVPRSEQVEVATCDNRGAPTPRSQG